MGELSIRREQDRSFAVNRFQKTEGTVKQSGVIASSKITQSPGAAVSETLRNLVNTMNRAADHSKESRQMLQTGEGALAEVQDKLKLMSALADRASSSGADTNALQAELEKLCQDIDRILTNASFGGTKLFTSVDASDLTAQIYQENLEELLSAILEKSQASGEVSDGQEAEAAGPALPDWLAKGLAQSLGDPETFLRALGLDKNATAEDIAAALAEHSLDSGPAAATLATLYLGAAIAGKGVPSPEASLADMMGGLEKLLEKMNSGMSFDEALQELTNGTFTGLADFEAQFTGGTAKDLVDFLAGLLLTESSPIALALPEMNLMAMLGDLGLGSALDLLMAHMAMPGELTPASASLMDLNSGMLPSQQIGGFQVVGRDLSGVSFDASTGVLTVSGTADVAIMGPGGADAAGKAAQAGQAAQTAQTAQTARSILITGSGTVALQNVSVPALELGSSEARLLSLGRSVLGTLSLKNGVSAVFGGGGLLDIGKLKGEGRNSLTLSGGAVMVDGGKGELGKELPVLIDGPAVLAAKAEVVRNIHSEALKPFDVVWKALLPDWSGISSVAVNGQQTAVNLQNNASLPELARLWLEKGTDPSHGHPVHTLTFYGKDIYGNDRVVHAYLQWNYVTGAFEEVTMYPNPFTVTGGEEGTDWEYDEDSQTLRILTSRVTGISGGRGVDANKEPFSGRIVLADGIGGISLDLTGVDCHVTEGAALDLGQENEVRLILRGGSENSFESGGGFAGIALGGGTALSISSAPAEDAGPDDSEHDGVLTAVGGSDSAGIGGSSGGSCNRSSRISIYGGVVNAEGGGAGAGIGASKRGFLGSVLISGGTVNASGGKNGGAGIGGALGASTGDIVIKGGRITAAAAYHACAIGSGLQGSVGDILIERAARILRAKGSDYGADIGACILGKCGKITVADKASIGLAGVRPYVPEGIPLQMGAETITLPQFHLSVDSMQLSKLSLSTKATVRGAKAYIEVAEQNVSRIRSAYNTLRNSLEQSLAQLRNGWGENMKSAVPQIVRDQIAAGKLQQNVRDKSTQAVKSHSEKAADNIMRFLR